ncbi:LppU/SCO3897 family protein [Pimelobacter simplex]|uniref:LppU/SCO3897 family protein n=1 Tax=Nocardioides simplex TaxID=2045 RepID=UPI003AACEF95
MGSIGLAIVIGLTVYFVGVCLSVTGTINAQHEELDCGDVDATYKVASDDGNCDASESPYKISIGSTNSGNVADLCLQLNAKKGDCFDLRAEKKVACAAAKGDSGVAKVVSVGKPGATCKPPAEAVENVKRKVVLCFGPAA